MKTASKYFLIFGLFALIFGSCVKQEFDEPEKTNVPVGTVLTIGDLRQMVIDSIQNVVGATNYRFTSDYTVYATVTMDENRAGNLYKSAYIQDSTGAINLQFLNSGSLYEGDSIRLNLKGKLLLEYNGAYQIDSIDIEKDIVKIATNKSVTPKTVTIADLMTGAYEAQLIKLEDVQFILGDLGKTYADFESNTNRTIEDCDENQVLVRTSGWATFYSETLPSGKGSVIAVASVYGSDIQLYIRSTDEVSMDSARCGGGSGIVYLNKDYTDANVFSGGWIQKQVVGTISWSIYGSTNPAASISNYTGGSNQACENWLISPVINLASATTPILSFRNCSGYTGDDLTVWVSTNYDGTSAPSSATWTQLSFTLAVADPYWSWTDSGPVNLTPYKNATTYIAFKYTGTSSNGKTWEIDDIIVQEQ